MPSNNSLTRRSFLAASAATSLTPAVGAKKTPVGLELYSVRDELAKDLMGTVYEKDYVTVALEAGEAETPFHDLAGLRREIKRLEEEMHRLARDLNFEEAAVRRDRVKTLKEKELQWL